MTTEAQKQEVIAAIKQVEDEALWQQLKNLLVTAAMTHNTAKPRAPLGFARGTGVWMADDFDEPLEDFADYM
ncbi:DUF2281 domain-containing protein [Hymenobacter sp. UV11]|uniref:DUF2281 domain-containing protein n=1 Tax=Hymenobacter sp. UV11 TaxID=1849735 RepID=UPI00105E0F61|nr:DUF2281 domain-containing protein [Hymenobacter sp. UV11]TDN35945.1 hypothetical protein A8B98_11050 [Hymenobacter sp. UV11]TFZ68242.1 DUF2281 domain-containing protein [Hymenobacter sp. UV11]